MIIRNCLGHGSILINCSPEIDNKIKTCGHFFILFSLSFLIEKQKLCQTKENDQDRQKTHRTHAYCV